MSGDPRTALPPIVLCCAPCLATDSAPETEISPSNNVSDDAALFATHLVSYPAQKLPLGQITIISSPEDLEITVLPPVDKDAFLSAREEVLPCDHIQSSPCGVKTPGPISGPISGAPLTPLCPMDTSPSPVVRTSGIFMHLTLPPSSPPTECNVSVAESQARDGEADCSSSITEIDGYPTITMSSPNLGFHEDEPPSSPSPHYQTTRTKRAQCEESDEVCCQKHSYDCL